MVGVAHHHPQISPAAQLLKDLQGCAILNVPGGPSVAKTVPGESHIATSWRLRADLCSYARRHERSFDLFDRMPLERKAELRVLTLDALECIDCSC